MKFLLLASLFVLSVVAEPEAQHETGGFVQHLNGAIVPDDTTSVKAQKALHYTAHVNAALNGFKAPFNPAAYVLPTVETPTVKAEVPKVMYPYTYGLQYPTTYTYPYSYGYPHTTYPYSYGYTHHLGKREAEAEPEAEPEADPAVIYSYPYTYGNQYPTTYTYPYTYGYPRTAYPYSYAYPHTAYPYSYGYTHHLGKREAEAEPEADPAFYYNTQVMHPYTHGVYPTTYKTPYTYVPTTYAHITAPYVTPAVKPVVTKKVETMVKPVTYTYPFTYTYPYVKPMATQYAVPHYQYAPYTTVPLKQD